MRSLLSKILDITVKVVVDSYVVNVHSVVGSMRMLPVKRKRDLFVDVETVKIR
jgi:hypothetical protein